MAEDAATELVGPTGSVDARPRSERSLLRDAAKGSADAAEQLARIHWAGAHRAAFLITHDREAAEDIAQEAILAALSSLRRFDRARSFRPWLHKIVANRAIDWLRARDRRREVQLYPVPQADVLAAHSSKQPHDEAGVAIDRLAALDPQSRAIVVMRCVFEYRPREIAPMVGLSAGAVRTRLHRALAELRNAIEEETG
jgi:RNA polymerase sigma-70 factor, ECF subfamily